MTVMLIRRHLRRSTTTINYQYPQLSPPQLHQAQPFQQQPQYPGTNPLKSAFRMTYFSSTRAMRYYRIWIYTFNAVLFVCVIGFIIVACKVLVADPRRSLISEFSLTHPSLLYAYCALIIQSGFLQLIGCIGARTLNEKLLNTYWLLLFILLIGDILLGVFWINHYEFIVAQMKPILKQRFKQQYGNNEEFTNLWDMIQRVDKCCGVDNYEDFYLNKSIISWAGTSTMEDGVTFMPFALLPPSCCGGVMEKELATIKAPEARRNMHISTTPGTTIPPLPPIFATEETISVTDYIVVDGIILRCSTDTDLFYTTGCEKRLIMWFRSRLDILFVLGYCVISFLKLCFLGILRYEIREMIQKIRILQSELRNVGEYQETFTGGVQKLQQIRRYDHNGSVVGVVQPLLQHNSSRDRDSVHSSDEGEISADSNLLFSAEKKGTPPENIGSLQNTSMPFNSGDDRNLSTFNQDTGNDSDTNSHCALIIKVDKSINNSNAINSGSAKIRLQKSSHNNSNKNNNNNIYEMQELNQILLSRNRTKT